MQEVTNVNYCNKTHKNSKVFQKNADIKNVSKTENNSGKDLKVYAYRK